ncbi:MAG: hypothetical protein U1D55_19025 [Phycisphaerae bacterium]
MINFCIFGAQEGELSLGKKLYVTVFGACEFKRPTLARQLIEARQRGTPDSPFRGQFFLTIFGASEISCPTLAEEFIELQDAIRGGALTWRDWDQAVAKASLNASSRTSSFTVFGAFDAAGLPSEDQELDALALHQHLGRIPDAASKMLMLAVGQGGAQRPAAVRQAASVA